MFYSRLTYDQSEGATSVYSLPDMKERTVLVDGVQQDVLHDGVEVGVGGDARGARREDRAALAVHSYGCVATFTQVVGWRRWRDRRTRWMRWWS